MSKTIFFDIMTKKSAQKICQFKKWQ